MLVLCVDQTQFLFNLEPGLKSYIAFLYSFVHVTKNVIKYYDQCLDFSNPRKLFQDPILTLIFVSNHTWSWMPLYHARLLAANCMVDLAARLEGLQVLCYSKIHYLSNHQICRSLSAFFLLVLCQPPTYCEGSGQVANAQFNRVVIDRCYGLTTKCWSVTLPTELSKVLWLE